MKVGPAMGGSSNKGLLIGIILGALVLMVAVLCGGLFGYSSLYSFSFHPPPIISPFFPLPPTLRLSAMLLISTCLCFVYFCCFLILFAALYSYRKRRAELVRDVANRQKSQINKNDLKLQERIGRGASGEVFKASFRGTEV